MLFINILNVAKFFCRLLMFMCIIMSLSCVISFLYWSIVLYLLFILIIADLYYFKVIIDESN